MTTTPEQMNNKSLPLEEQVVSLELARKMKELGAPQKSLFMWTQTYTRKTGALLRDSKPYLQKTPKGKVYPKDFAAYTVAELLELLGDKFGVLERFKHSGKFGAYIPNDIGVSATGEKVADVLAELYINAYGG